MHEFALTQTIVQNVLAELKKVQPARLIGAKVVVGRMHQIVPANLTFAYDVLTKATPAEGSTLTISAVPIKVRCSQCAWSGEIKGSNFVCGDCGAGDIEITGGRELYLESIEVEQDHERSSHEVSGNGKWGSPHKLDSF